MSKTQSTLKDVAHDPDDQITIDLATIVAETTSTVADLPDWNQYTMACTFVLETVERYAAAEEI